MGYDSHLAHIKSLGEDALLKLKMETFGAMDGINFVPNPGGQTEAYFCKADVLLYGGSAGSGKTGLLLGLALTAHTKSLILRPQHVELQGLQDDLIVLNGSRDGFTGGARPRLTKGDKVIDLGAVGDNPKAHQGVAHDLLGFDEVTNFKEDDVRYLQTWVRLAAGVDRSQRTRTVFATNPPTSSDGDWVIPYFAPWLDPNYDDPAQFGEIRWVVSDPDGNDYWVAGPEPYQFPGQERPVQPESRTFIPGKLSDNPYLINTKYATKLDALKEPYRSAMRDGNFMIERTDADKQIIPSHHVKEAQERWDEKGRVLKPMTCLGADVAGGGADSNELAPWHEYWCDKLHSLPGKEAKEDSDVAAFIVKHRRNGCPVAMDMSGGYGGAPKVYLTQNEIKVFKFKGGEATHEKDGTGEYGFVNLITAAYFFFAEALNPDQDGGSQICLPYDVKLQQELCAPRFEVVTHNGCQCYMKEPKAKIKKRLGRSPDKADAVVIGWYYQRMLLQGLLRDSRGGQSTVRVQLGYTNRKKR